MSRVTWVDGGYDRDGLPAFGPACLYARFLISIQVVGVSGS